MKHVSKAALMKLLSPLFVNFFSQSRRNEYTKLMAINDVKTFSFSAEQEHVLCVANYGLEAKELLYYFYETRNFLFIKQ